MQIGEGFPGAKAAPIWKTGSVPVNDNNDECDGVISALCSLQ